MPSARKSPLPWILPLVIGLATLFLSRLHLSENLEYRLLDTRFKIRGPRSVADSPFQIVAVDDQTLNLLDEKWPFRGSKYAHFLRNLKRAGARLIVFDIEFTEPNSKFPEEDSLFAEAVKEVGNVILAGKISYPDPGEYFEEAYSVPVPPLPVLQETGAPWGIVNEFVDPDGFTRRYLLYLLGGKKPKLTIGLETLRSLQQLPEEVEIEINGKKCRFGDLSIPLYDSHSFLINYYGPAGTFHAISFSSVLDDSTFDLGSENDSNYMERFFHDGGDESLKNPFEGKIVLVGASVEEMQDTKNTPFYDYKHTPQKTPGVEVHTHALQTVLDRSFIIRTHFWIVSLYSLIISYLIFFLVGAKKPLRGLIYSILLVGCVFIIALVLFIQGNIWMDLAAPLFAIGLTYLGASLHNYFRERSEKAMIRDMFAHYVPNKVVNELISKPELLALGGQRRRLSILFTDIAGFTTITEKIEPEELVDLLNEYMTAMTEVIIANDGIVDKYEGDLIMAEFGAPVPYPEHAEKACRSALQMQKVLTDLRPQWKKRGKPELSNRVGINTGDVIVGNMGSREVFDYTVLGDAVNLSSRLEEANKLYKTTIMISQYTHDELPPEFVTRVLGDIRVRGRQGKVRVHELIAASESDIPEEKHSFLSIYHQGWKCFDNRRFGEAVEHFQRALAVEPDDYPSQLYLKHCQKFSLEPPPEDWDGILSFDE